MKRLIALMFAMMFAFGAFAQEAKKPELNPEQKLAVANAVTALIVGAPAVLWAVTTGNQETLCKVLGGSYNPAGPDLCPTGNWVAIIPFLKKD